MLISHFSESVRYTGRWDKGEKAAVTTAPGAMFEVAFCGSSCDLMFDTDMNAERFPHLYVQLDKGAKIEVPVDRYIRVEAPDDGAHVVTVYFKSAVEAQHRWYMPLVGKISFIGAEADAEGVLPEDHRDIIEFIGDSITEGIWVDDFRRLYGSPNTRNNMVFQNDATATYAYLTAQMLGMKPYIMGYGAVGVTKSGGGGVPKAAEAYPYAYDNVPIEPSGAKIIVINHGTNDIYAGVERYLEEYPLFLDLVRSRNPNAIIVAMSVFNGTYKDELRNLISEYNRTRGDSIVFINGSDWIPPTPMHPLRDGHRIAAEHLAAELTKLLTAENAGN